MALDGMQEQNVHDNASKRIVHIVYACNFSSA